MVNMGDLRPEVVDQAAGDPADVIVAVGFLERARAPERVVHEGDREPAAVFNANVVFGTSRIRLARQDAHSVAERVKRARVRFGIDLRAAERAEPSASA